MTADSLKINESPVRWGAERERIRGGMILVLGKTHDSFNHPLLTKLSSTGCQREDVATWESKIRADSRCYNYHLAKVMIESMSYLI